MSTIEQTRTDWHAERAKAIGASEMPSLFGVGWETPLQLYARKLGAIGRTEESEAMEIGTLIQPTIAALLERRTNLHIIEAPQNEFLRHSEFPFIGCTPDAYLASDERPDMGVAEYKNVGHHSAGDWDEGVPLRTQVQIQGQLAVTGYQWGVAAALLGGNKFVWHRVERNEAFISTLIETCREFWRRIQDQDPPPVDGDKRTTAALFALHPNDNGESVQLPDELTETAEELAALDRVIKDAEERQAEITNSIRSLIGDATYGLLPDGSGWSWKTQVRKAYEVKESTSRVLRRIKAKGTK
jgi:putative phage-type endonuclease